MAGLVPAIHVLFFAAMRDAGMTTRGGRLRTGAGADVAGGGADAGRVLQGQAGQHLCRLLRRRHLRPLCPRAGAPYRQAHPRQSERRAAQHGRRRHRCGSRTTSIRWRRATAPRSPPSGARPWRRRCSASPPRSSIRAEFSWLGSANDEVSICAAWHTSGITRFDDLKAQGICLRRHRADRRGGADLQDHERAARHQDPHRVGLSRRQPDQSRDRARRDPRPLRAVVVEREGDAAALARRQEAASAHPGGVRQARRAAGRAAADRPRARTTRRATCSASWWRGR